MVQFTTTAVALLVLTAFTAALGAFAVRRRPTPGATTFGTMLFAVALWNGALTVATLFPTRAIHIVGDATIFASGLAIAFFVLFALEFTGREHLLRRDVAGALLVEPVVATALSRVNPDDLFWATEMTADGVSTVTLGPLFFTHVGYSYLLLSGGTVLMLGKLYRSPSLQRAQTAAILLALGAAWVGDVAYLVVGNPLPHALGFTVYGLALCWAMFDVGLVDVTPVARSTVMEQLDVAVLVLDEQNRVTDLNPHGRSLLGVGDADVVGERFTDLVDHEVAEEYVDVDHADEEVTVDTAAGQRTFHLQVSAVTDRLGRHRGRVCIFQDVTEHRRRERELERKNEQLTQFADMVSHDLRNPLQVAYGQVELLGADYDDERIDKLGGELDRMSAIIEDVLALARGTDTSEDLDRLDLGAVAREAWGHVDTGAATLDVRDTRRLDADRSRLLQAFENLFRNSVEHGGSAVTVSVGVLDGDRGFYVEDDGVGIPPADRETVFEPGVSGSDDGTGLGLNIVRQVAAAHGWTVAIADAETDGARFEFTGVGPVTTEPTPEAESSTD